VGIMLNYGIEDNVRFNCEFIIYLFVKFRLTLHVILLYCIHYLAFIVYGMLFLQEILGKFGFMVVVFEIS